MIKRYGFLGCLYILYCVIRTKVLLPKAKIIRFPIDLRNFNQMEIGNGFTTGKNCRLEVEGTGKKLFIGKNVQMNDFCHVTAGEMVTIHDNVLMASKVYISDVSHGGYGMTIHSPPDSIPKNRPLVSSPVVIEKNVWLGDGVCVLPGVTIGEGAIIGANAVVTKDIPANSIAVGIPAKPIKKFNFDKKEWQRIN